MQAHTFTKLNTTVFVIPFSIYFFKRDSDQQKDFTQKGSDTKV